MARSRDPFALALETLRRRAAAGAFHPERPIVIQNEARRLGLSTTPVREALAWMCGAGLVQRAATGGYLGARLDVAGLRSRYVFRLQCLRLAVDAAPALPPGGWAEPAPQPGASSAASVFREIMQRSGDDVLQDAFHRVELQLEPVAASEARVMGELQAEVEALARRLAQEDPAPLVEALILFHRRRVEFALPLLLDLESRSGRAGAEP